jgi:hypothetical protein
VSETVNSGSIISELDERLDDIFGQDESDGASFGNGGGSPLAELKGLMLTIDWEISDDTISAFNSEVDHLKRLYVGDQHVPPLFKMMSSLMSYLQAKKGDAHPDTINVLKSIYNSLEIVVEDSSISAQGKKGIIDKEIENFKKFKIDIVSGAKPQVKKAAPQEKPAKNLESIFAETESEPAGPSPEKTVETRQKPAEQTEPVDFEPTIDEADSIASPEEQLHLEAPEASSDLASASGQLKDAAAVENLRSFMGTEFEALKSRLDGLQKGANGNSGSTLEEGGFDALKNQIDDLKGLFSAFSDPAAFFGEDFKTFMNQVGELKGSFNNLGDLRSYMREEFTAMKDQTDLLKEEVSQLRGDLLSTRSELEKIKSTLEQEPAAAAAKPFSAAKSAASVDNETSTPNDDIPVLDVPEVETPVEELAFEIADSAEEEQILEFTAVDEEDSSPPSDSDMYFLFQMGGKRYAVDQRNVIKVTKGGGRLLKKARDKREISLMDCRPMFTSLKRGIEPAWRQLTAKELKTTRFPLIIDDRLEGLWDTKGGAVLFMGSGEERSALFADSLPKKKDVTEGYIVRKGSGAKYICGSIIKKDEGGEEYLILDASQFK